MSEGTAAVFFADIETDCSGLLGDPLFGLKGIEKTQEVPYGIPRITDKAPQLPLVYRRHDDEISA